MLNVLAQPHKQHLVLLLLLENFMTDSLLLPRLKKKKNWLETENILSHQITFGEFVTLLGELINPDA